MQEKNKFPVKNAIIVILVFGIVFFGYATYALYHETLRQYDMILQQSNAIGAYEKIVSNLTQSLIISKQTIDTKQILISDLSSKLGIAESEILGLLPITKDYSVIGVKNNGEGLIIPIQVKMSNGTGLVSVNIKNVDTQSGVQSSIRVATYVANQYTKTNTANKDITVSFLNPFADIVTVEGPSAGGAITLGIIAAIQNKSVNGKVLMTGTIEEDGKIGKVGGVLEKAKAAKDNGAEIILVPSGQRVAVNGIDVREVERIDDAVDIALR